MALGGKKHYESASRHKGVLTKDAPWGVQEAYKSLRTNVLFSLPDSECKVIGVTSAAAGDGKSTNATNLAISMGQIDSKVLLVEGDMRRPGVSPILQIKGKPGLSDLLARQSEFTDCLRHMAEYGIDVIPAGSIPPDPTWLLQSKVMRVLIDQLKKMYHFIIIDFPPVTAVTDVSIMSQYCDGFVMVVRHNVTDTRLIRAALQQMDRVNAHILGFVYNDVTQEGGKYYYNNYKYEYKSNKNK